MQSANSAGELIYANSEAVNPCPKYEGQKMSKGYVYILSNPSMPGLLKIGKTIRNGESRAIEIYQTGVPEPFKVEHEVFSPHCGKLEHSIHCLMHDVRVSNGREFFRSSVTDAVQILDQGILDQVKDMVGEFLPEHDIVEISMSVDQSRLHHLAYNNDTHPYNIVDAVGLLTPDEIRPALDRNAQRAQGRIKGMKSALKVVGEQ